MEILPTGVKTTGTELTVDKEKITNPSKYLCNFNREGTKKLI